jgi:hypothetical protein
VVARVQKLELVVGQLLSPPAPPGERSGATTTAPGEAAAATASPFPGPPSILISPGAPASSTSAGQAPDQAPACDAAAISSWRVSSTSSRSSLTGGSLNDRRLQAALLGSSGMAAGGSALALAGAGEEEAAARHASALALLESKLAEYGKVMATMRNRIIALQVGG